MGGNLANYTSTTVGFNDASDNAFNLPNQNAVWLVNFTWAAATAISTVPTVTASGGAVELSPWIGGAGTGFFLAAGTSATISSVFTSTLTGVPASTTNLITIGGLATMTDGNPEIYIVRLPSNLVTLLKSMKEDDRMARLELMVKELTMRNVDDWNCRPSQDDRKPKIPLRSLESDEKSSSSISRKFFK